MSHRDEAEAKPRIVHLEDDPADRELIRETLGAEGIPLEVVQVGGKAEFEAALAHGDVALVLSDFSLPRFDGFSALEIVQQQKPNLPFIFVSGTMGEEAAIESLRRGATDYVLKQRLSRLGPAVRRALEDVAVRQTRLQAAEGAANRQRFMNAMLDSLDAGIMACDASGVLTMSNRAAREIVGLAEAAIPPEQWAQYYNLYQPDGKRLLEMGALPRYRALRGERVRDVEVLIRRRDGQARMVLVSGQPILGVHGGSLGAVIAIRDITERK
ncbi:MAG TPA: response regulator, partial [Candidatus Eisenbacteria bacterium]|nr:response regulator [Candidatus Eisenbacteria bacterium]